MIGYIIEQELGNELPQERPLATLLTMIEVDGERPRVRRTRRSRSGRSTTQEEADRLAAEKGWTFKPDGDSFRRVVPSPAAAADLRDRADQVAARAGRVVICAGGGGIPTPVRRRAGAGGPAARRRRGGDRQGSRERAARDRPRRRRARDRHRRRRRLHGLGHARAAADPPRDAGGARATASSPRARWGRRCAPPASSSRRPAGGP